MLGKDITWWYWAATVLLLALGLAGWPVGLVLALTLSAVQVLHLHRREGSVAAFSVQVRLAYLGLMLLGLWDPLRFILWIQLIGTSAMVLFGYCLLARVLSLLPWNRTGPLSMRIVARTFLSAPVKGSVLQGLPAE